MPKALHVIAEQIGASPKGVSRGNGPAQFISGCWAYLGEDPEQLIGGWIYLHDTSSALSKMGGKVTGISRCTRDTARADGIAFEFTNVSEAKNVKWRGTGNVRHGHGGFTDANEPHERLG
jgi:hypothetical protein